jgi:hypothetical protein
MPLAFKDHIIEKSLVKEKHVPFVIRFSLYAGDGLYDGICRIVF